MMREKLKEWILEAVSALGGEATIVDVAKYIWTHHQSDLEAAGDFFYIWQYEMRWAAQRLRDENLLALAPRRKWALAGKAQ
jgi:hypothetical protein